MRKKYFEGHDNSIQPLTIVVPRRVRFEETDQLGIVWHGRYPSYFEDGRTALGEKYGIGYLNFYKNRVVAPIKQIHVDYDRPLRFPDEFSIETSLHWSDAARINISYLIRDKDGAVATTGYTVQVMLDPDYNLLLLSPPFFEEFRQKWRAGEFG